MGMFDFVDFSRTCPTCGTLITEFQTKDFLSVLTTIKPWMVPNFYAICPECNTSIEYTRGIDSYLASKSIVDLVCAGSAAILFLEQIYTKLKTHAEIEDNILAQIKEFLSYDILNITEDKWLDKYSVQIFEKERT